MAQWLERTELLIGETALQNLLKSHVLIVGLGGIGSFAAEFIARGGVGKITIIDGDAFDATNKNRQLTALDSTIGKNKAVVLAERLRDINPEIELIILEEFVVPERVWEILKSDTPDYVVDCIDSVTPKLEWIVACIALKIKIISSMGAGGKLDPSKVKISSLTKTENCKLAAHIKKRLRKRNVEFKKVKAVSSSEIQIKGSLKMTDGSNFKRSFYGTISYMPALFGLYASAEVLEFLVKK
jgi:tRNA A37 threonylcarbamoyladenosine dehydratase